MIHWHALQTLGQLLNDGELDEIELEDESLRIRLSRTPPGSAAVPVQAPAGGPAEAPVSPAEGGAEEARSEDWVAIESPMVGTFYEAPAPDAEPFVEMGERVTFDTTVCIIEAMKLMNEIEAECEGVIREKCKEDAESVSKGDVLFYVEPD